MKRFLSFLAAVSLLSFTACNENNPADTPDVTPVFPDQVATGIVTNEDPFTLTLTPNMDWTVKITESEYFSLSNETTPRYSISGLAKTEAEIKVYATDAEPVGTAVCEVSLTMGGQTQVVATVTRFGAEAPAFSIYGAVESSNPEDPELFLQDADGNFVYSEETTDALTLIDNAYGEKSLQQRFRVVSEKDWIITEKPAWIFYGRSTGFDNENGSGKAGATDVFVLGDDSLRPFEDTTETIVFTEDSEASDASVLGTLDISIAGCGDIIFSNWEAETLFNASGMMYSQKSGGFLEYAAVGITAGYGSQIAIIAADNWIQFDQAPEFETEDYDGNDLTKAGLQSVIGTVSCDYNGDEERTAYLIGIPVNKVKEGFTADKAATADGKLAEGYEQFILSTITQVSAAPSDANALVKWAWSEEELGGFEFDDFATLETIRPAADEDIRTGYFTGEWATAPVAYAVTYKNLDAITVAALDVVEHASVEVYGVNGPYSTEAGLTPEWASWKEESGYSIITLNYDYDTDVWNCEKPEEFAAFFVLKDKDGKVITWIMFTLDSEDRYVEGEKKEVIEGAASDSGSVSLFNLNEGEPGYEDNYSAVPQYKLEMINTTSVNFDRVPSGSYKVYDANTGEEHAEWFQRLGTTSFVVETETEEAALLFYVIFTNATGAPVAVLYVDYLYGEPAITAGQFAGVKSIDIMGNEKGTATLTELKEGDHGFDPEMTGHQYLLDVANANFVQFETFPEGIDSIWSDGQDVDYQAGIISFFPTTNEAEFDIVFKKEFANIAAMHVHYSADEIQGGDKTDVPFALDQSSIAAGAIVRKTTTADEWYTPFANEATEQWTLIFNGENDTVTFTNFPETTSDLTITGAYNYFEILSTGSMTSVALLGDAWGEETSAEYNVFFYGMIGGSEEVTYRLHVRYNMDGGNQPGDGGEDDEPTGIIALAEGNNTYVTLRETTEADSWYMSVLDYDQWTLIVKGPSDTVLFSAMPNAEDLMILEDQENEKGYFQIEQQGVTYVVSLMGESYDEGSATYTVIFYDPQWGDACCRLHVEYSNE